MTQFEPGAEPAAARVLFDCNSESLQPGGLGQRFDVSGQGSRAITGFVVRDASGGVRAFLNQCTHVPVELDWQPGQFFDFTGHFLLCSVHGAHYDPASGQCVAGPCRGSLRSLPVIEQEGRVRVFERHSR